MVSTLRAESRFMAMCVYHLSWGPIYTEIYTLAADWSSLHQTIKEFTSIKINDLHFLHGTQWSLMDANRSCRSSAAWYALPLDVLPWWPRRTGFTSEHGSRTGETTGANDNEPAGPARESQARQRQRARALRTRIKRVLLKVTGVSRITIAAQ